VTAAPLGAEPDRAPAPAVPPPTVSPPPSVAGLMVPAADRRAPVWPGLIPPAPGAGSPDPLWWWVGAISSGSRRRSAVAALKVTAIRADTNADPEGYSCAVWVRISRANTGAVPVVLPPVPVVLAPPVARVAAVVADSQTFEPTMEQARRNTGRAPKQALADAGYCSETNLEAATKLTDQHGTEFLIATGRLSHDEAVEPAPRGRIPKDFTLKQRMARKLRTKTGQAGYARRKAIVEPVFGQIATLQGKHVLLRGLDNVRHEWELLAACHNLRKLHGHLGVVGLGSLRAAT